jgi:hypothetical protein
MCYESLYYWVQGVTGGLCLPFKTIQLPKEYIDDL